MLNKILGNFTRRNQRDRTYKSNETQYRNVIEKKLCNEITWNQFHNDVDGLSLRADSDKLDDVGMIVLLENSV